MAHRKDSFVCFNFFVVGIFVCSQSQLFLAISAREIYIARAGIDDIIRFVNQKNI